MKYYLDEDISPKVAELLRKHEIDTVSTHDVSRVQASDREKLDYAAGEGRAMVTRNQDDFVLLTVQFFNELRPHAGVLIIPYSIPGDQFAHTAKALEKYALDHPSGMAPYTIDFVQPLDNQGHVFGADSAQATRQPLCG